VYVYKWKTGTAEDAANAILSYMALENHPAKSGRKMGTRYRVST